MRISVVGPVLNEVDFIGQSIMAALPYVHEFIYTLDEKSNDGTRELLRYIKEKYAHEKLIVLEHPTFHPSDMERYNAAFNVGIGRSTGDACWFLHPDMIVTEWPDVADSCKKVPNCFELHPDAVLTPQGPLAWWVTVTSFARDFRTVITKGRTDRWKNIHAKRLGLHYFGGYGSQNEDFYHSDITGRSYKHYGSEFSKYPFEVADSGIKLNHYCELKGYARRLEKMKLCLKTQHPQADAGWIEERATHHPRVTLEPTTDRFGAFEFKESDQSVPEVFSKYADEFSQFKKEPIASA